MLKRIKSLHPSPALIVSLLALVLAMGGFAIAAIPDNSGVFHACYKKKKGTLRLVSSSSKCKKSERATSWNQKGQNGAKGANGANGAKGAKGDTGAAGATTVAMRTGSPVSITENGFDTASASCNAGERATGGGVYPNSNVFYPHVVASFPTPNPSAFTTPNDGTTPTGWRVWVSNQDAANSGGADSAAPASVTVTPYVLCAAP